MSIRVIPKYGAIEAARDICEPWIHAWGGDEWGDSMYNLHGAAHTDYGFSDEDCALFAQKLIDNLIAARDNVLENDIATEQEMQLAAEEAAKQRDYWLAGGNLGDWGTTKSDAKSVIDQLPGWLFGEEDHG